MARPYRYAALIVGAPPDDVAAKTATERAVRTARGVVILGDETVANAYEGAPGVTMYEVTHWLDKGDFWVSRSVGEQTAIYEVPRGPHPGDLEILTNVEGETEPRAIARNLGIPEDFLFPAQ